MNIKRREIAIALAPDRPPCFPSDRQWHQFVAEAATEQRPDSRPGRPPRGPLHLKKDSIPAFNLGWYFCADCPSTHRAAKQAEGKCDPDVLIRAIGGSHGNRVPGGDTQPSPLTTP